MTSLEVTYYLRNKTVIGPSTVIFDDDKDWIDWYLDCVGADGGAIRTPAPGGQTFIRKSEIVAVDITEPTPDKEPTP